MIYLSFSRHWSSIFWRFIYFAIFFQVKRQRHVKFKVETLKLWLGLQSRLLKGMSVCPGTISGSRGPAPSRPLPIPDFSTACNEQRKIHSVPGSSSVSRSSQIRIKNSTNSILWHKRAYWLHLSSQKKTKLKFLTCSSVAFKHSRVQSSLFCRQIGGYLSMTLSAFSSSRSKNFHPAM